MSAAASLHAVHTDVCHQPSVRTNILSLDGGGDRIIIGLTLLEEIEARTGKATCELFDLVAGTSSGSIIATALAIKDTKGNFKYTAKRVRELFEQRAPKIFHASCFGGLRQLFYPKYRSDNLNCVLDEFLGNTLMKDLAVPIVIPSCNTTTGETWIFEREGIIIPRPPEDQEMRWTCHGKFTRQNADPLTAKDIVMASTAAQTYFPLYDFVVRGARNMFMDGGNAANNPCVVAYTVARKTFKENKPENNFLVCSIGTGYAPSILPPTSKFWGILSWLPRIIEILLNNSAAIAHQEMVGLLPAGTDGKRYFRFQVILPEDLTSLDNPGDMAQLRAMAQAMIAKESVAIDDLCTKLLATKGLAARKAA